MENTHSTTIVIQGEPWDDERAKAAKNSAALDGAIAALNSALDFIIAVKIAGQKESLPNVPPPYSLETKIRAAIAKAERCSAEGVDAGTEYEEGAR